MGLGNFSRDIESKPEATFGVLLVLIFRAALEGLKDVVEVRFLNDRTTVSYLKTNFHMGSGHTHMHRRVWCPVLDPIPHQVAD